MSEASSMSPTWDIGSMVLGGGSDSISEEVCNVKPFHELKLKGFFCF